MNRAAHVLVIGAGPAGLAAAASLGKVGIPYTLIEKELEIGSSWRRHYDRLHLHTTKRLSHLPFLRFPRSYPRYVPKDGVVSYLERYAERMRIHPRFGERVEHAERSGEAWIVRTNAGVHEAAHLVVATGLSEIPFRPPPWPGEESFRGEILHASRYSNGRRFSGKSVLVIGIGNTGGELAIDLAEHGATAIISVRGPVHVVPRDSFGLPAQIAGLVFSRLPVPLADRIARSMAERALGDLSPWGLARPSYGPVTQVLRFGRIPLIDVGTVDLVKRGVVRIVPAVSRFHAGGVELADGSRLELDAVILATGYRTGLDQILPDFPRFAEVVPGRLRISPEAAAAGLHFLGFSNPVTGALRTIALEARALARRLSPARSVRYS